MNFTINRVLMIFILFPGIERNCYRQQKPRSEKICHFSQSRLKDQKYTSPHIRTCLKLCFKDRVRMEQREPTGDPNVEGRLRELASKWFIDTQVPLIVKNGLFPTWFLGFITRKDAEEMLREKELGCFLIRLSEKALGYILSYKGRDRCRHFVINQSETGQFVVCGDTEGHDTVPDLIEHYKSSPIEPFGEYLTCSCFEAMDEELYDIIQFSPKEKPVVPVRSVNKTRQQQINPEQQPAPPPRSNRTSEEVPPLPRRSRHFDSSINDRERVLYAQLRKQSPRAQHNSQDSLPGRAERSTNKDQNIGRCSPPSGPKTAYSELGLLECKSRSLPLLDNISDEEQPYRLSVPPDTPPRLSPRPGRQVTSCVPQPEKKDKCSRPSSNHSLDHMSDGAVYHLAGSPHTTLFDTRSSIPNQHDNSVYAEVSTEDPSGRFPHDSAYELIPNHKETAQSKPNSNTYEPLEDIRRKHNSWGLKVSSLFQLWRKCLRCKGKFQVLQQNCTTNICSIYSV
uniref:SH2 domain-containing protein n=1 Tax=Amphiprion ocellaris TaxID=80972 RepID=A0A3Q1ALX7_AMPOC